MISAIEVSYRLVGETGLARNGLIILDLADDKEIKQVIAFTHFTTEDRIELIAATSAATGIVYSIESGN